MQYKPIKQAHNMKSFYYIWVNGVRLRVTAETLRQYKEEERQERIKKMNRRDKEKRDNTLRIETARNSFVIPNAIG